MNWIADNAQGIRLSDDLRVFVAVDSNVGYIVYAQLLKQFRLPSNELYYSKNESGIIWAEEMEDSELFDGLLYEQLDLSEVVSPTKLLTFRLLTRWLETPFSFNGLALVHGKKKQFKFPVRPFNVLTFGEGVPLKNDVDRFLYRKLKLSDIKSTIAEFFARIDASLESKLFSVMAFYQAETGIVVEKSALLSRLFDAKRNIELKKRLEKEINNL